MKKKDQNWDLIITNKSNNLISNFLELKKYIDLIYFFIKRDFVVFYKQTILGPIWYVIQPLINTIVFTIIFGNLANISTEKNNPFLFYLAGTILWSYFSVCLNLTSKTFITNSSIYGKVYYPRIVNPIAYVLFSLLQFSIQFFIFIGFLIYFKSLDLLNYKLFLIPLLIFQLALLAIGIGLLVSSLTTKYRDLNLVLDFFIQVWMFVTPIVYPLSIVDEKYRLLVCLNPVAPIVEVFKDIFFNSSVINSNQIFLGIFITFIIFILGIKNFYKVEKNFMDTI